MKKIHEDKEDNFFNKKIQFTVLIFVIVCSISYFVFYKFITIPKNRIIEYNYAYKENWFNNNPGLFHNFFVKDIRNGINDKYTKSSIYFITKRYEYNGGNIYEVSDYIDSNPELSFIKEAELIYPDVFNKLKDRKIYLTYTDNGMYVYLAYLEILEKYNYTDIAVLGTLSGQYAKIAYYKKMILDDKSKGKSLEYPDYTESQIQNDITKSLFFANKSKEIVTSILEDKITSKEIPEPNILFGVIQYASALRYLDASDVNFSPTKSSQEIFAFATTYSYHFLQDLYLFTSLTNASTLLLSPLTTGNELRGVIYPFLTFNPKVISPKGDIARIIQARYELHTSRFTDLSIYSKVNILLLANKVPEFKAWLMLNGWTENNFK